MKVKRRKRKIRKTRLFIILLIIFGLIYLRINEYLNSVNKNNHENTNVLSDHDYDLNKLNKVNEFYYYEDNKYTSLVGIDISTHQKDINFNKVKNAGVDFVIIRIGYRGYSEGKLHLDNKFEEYYEKASKAGLKIGFYFFSQAINEKEAIEEAEFVLKNIKGKKFDLPIAYDYEDASPVGRISLLSKDEKTKNAIAFLERIKRNNYPYMLYTNLYWTEHCYELEKLKDYDIWFAQYYKYPQYPHNFLIWQYSEDGIIDGIDEKVDLNIMFLKK